jgi:hypothetical protein
MRIYSDPASEYLVVYIHLFQHLTRSVVQIVVGRRSVAPNVPQVRMPVSADPEMPDARVKIHFSLELPKIKRGLPDWRNSIILDRVYFK